MPREGVDLEIHLELNVRNDRAHFGAVISKFEGEVAVITLERDQGAPGLPINAVKLQRKAARPDSEVRSLPSYPLKAGI